MLRGRVEHHHAEGVIARARLANVQGEIHRGRHRLDDVQFRHGFAFGVEQGNHQMRPEAVHGEADVCPHAAAIGRDRRFQPLDFHFFGRGGLVEQFVEHDLILVQRVVGVQVAREGKHQVVVVVRHGALA